MGGFEVGDPPLALTLPSSTFPLLSPFLCEETWWQGLTYFYGGRVAFGVELVPPFLVWHYKVGGESSFSPVEAHHPTEGLEAIVFH